MPIAAIAANVASSCPPVGEVLLENENGSAIVYPRYPTTSGCSAREINATSEACVVIVMPNKAPCCPTACGVNAEIPETNQLISAPPVVVHIIAAPLTVVHAIN